MDNNMVSKISFGMCATNIHLLQFKIQSHLQKTMTLNDSESELIPMKNIKNFYHDMRHFAFFSLTELPSWVLWNLLS